jgi:hypothetical protein
VCCCYWGWGGGVGRGFHYVHSSTYPYTMASVRWGARWGKGATCRIYSILCFSEEAKYCRVMSCEELIYLVPHDVGRGRVQFHSVSLSSSSATPRGTLKVGDRPSPFVGVSNFSELESKCIKNCVASQYDKIRINKPLKYFSVNAKQIHLRPIINGQFWWVLSSKHIS